MASRIEGDDKHTVASGTRQIVITTIGAALFVIGSAIVSALIAQGWRWDAGLVAVLLIIEGIDCLYAGVTGRNGASPILLAYWPLS